MREQVERAFENELRNRGLTAVRLDDGRYQVRQADGTIQTISIDNLVRMVAVDGNIASVQSFVDVILSPETADGSSPPYSSLRLALESSRIDLGSCVTQSVTTQLSRVLASAGPDERTVEYPSRRAVEDMEGGCEAALQQARANMATLLSGTPVEYTSAAGHPLAMFETHSVFKASLLCAPNLKECVAGRLGWPVVAIAPARDFLMVFAAADANSLVPRLGSVVVREYSGSAYPLTSEVLRVSDDGIVAIGAFDVGQE